MEFVLILTETTAKTNRRAAHAPTERRPIEVGSFYSIREITDKQSPWYVASPSTIFRALREGRLAANYLGRAVRLKGSAILALLGEEGGVA